MAKPVGEPIIPRSAKSPLGENRRVKRARKSIRKAARSARDYLIDQVSKIPSTVIGTTNSTELTGNARKIYEYLIDANALERIIQETQNRYRQGMSKATQDEAANAYEVGAGNEAENLRAMTEDYKRTIGEIVTSQPFQNRVAFIRSRVFEQMEGFYGQTGSDLSRVLGDALELGESPTRVAKKLRDRFQVSISRAERIALTEINNAQRRGGWDTAEVAEQELNIHTKEMHLSAFKPTTRDDHAARHGKLYTRTEVREWYTQDANAINCYCSQVSVMVDENGEPLSTKAIDRAKKVRDRFTK